MLIQLKGVDEQINHPYKLNYSQPRSLVYRVVTSVHFDVAITLIIVLNVCTMLAEHYMMPQVILSF